MMRKTLLVASVLVAGAAATVVLAVPAYEALAQVGAAGGRDPGGGGGGGGGNDPGDDPGRGDRGRDCIGLNCGPPPGWPRGHDCNSGGPDCGEDELTILMQCLCAPRPPGQPISCGDYKPVDIAEICGR